MDCPCLAQDKYLKQNLQNTVMGGGEGLDLSSTSQWEASVIWDRTTLQGTELSAYTRASKERVVIVGNENAPAYLRVPLGGAILAPREGHFRHCAVLKRLQDHSCHHHLNNNHTGTISTWEGHEMIAEPICEGV